VTAPDPRESLDPDATERRAETNQLNREQGLRDLTDRLRESLERSRAAFREQEATTIEEIARSAGFNSERELHRMVASANLLRRWGLRDFEVWKRDDGSKAGLLARFPETAAAQDSEQPEHKLRQAIAANVEALGCRHCWHHRDGPDQTLAPLEHLADCPVSVAAAIKGGKL
jgi:hypothetical protein